MPVARVKKINQAGQNGREPNGLDLPWICLNLLSQTSTDKWDLEVFNFIYVILLGEKNGLLHQIKSVLIMFKK